MPREGLRTRGPTSATPAAAVAATPALLPAWVGVDGGDGDGHRGAGRMAPCDVDRVVLLVAALCGSTSAGEADDVAAHVPVPDAVSWLANLMYVPHPKGRVGAWACRVASSATATG